MSWKVKKVETFIWSISEADDDEPLPVCSGMCSISDFKNNLIPHAEAGLEKSFTVNGGTTQFVYKGKYQVDFLKKATSFLNKLANAAQDTNHCAVEAADVECLCTQDLNAVVDGLKDIAKKTLSGCEGELLNHFFQGFYGAINEPLNWFSIFWLRFNDRKFRTEIVC